MISVKVFWKESGKPAQGKRVAVSFDGWTRGITGNEFTDSNGEVHFDADPGMGKVYVSGDTVFTGRIEGRVIVYV